MGNLWRFVHVISLSGIVSANSGFDEEIYQLANEILEDYFQVFKCVTYAADDARNADYLGRALPLVLVKLSLPEGEPAARRVFVEAFEQGCGGIIVQTSAAHRPDVVRSLRNAKSETVGYRYNTERYLFLPVAENDTDAHFLQDRRMFYLTNLVFVSRDASSGSLAITTHTIFDPTTEDHVQVVDTWTRSAGFERRANIYSDKLLNLNGKKVVFALMQYHPYSVVIQEPNQTLFDGIEARLSKIYLDVVNGTFVGQDHPKNLWGTKFPNGSGNGIIGAILKEEADVGYSAVYQWYCDVVDCTFPYVFAEAVCLVPRPKLLSSWVTLWLPFETSTWIALAIAYCISSCVVFLLRLAVKHMKGTNVPGFFLQTAVKSAFDVYGLHLQQVPKLAYSDNPVANFIKISLFFYFFVSVFWQGGIASILTVPRYEKPIDSPEEMVAHWPKLEWGSVHDVWIHSIENSTDPVLVEIVKKYLVLENDTLVRRSKLGNFAYFLERLPYNHFGFNDHINRETVPHLRLMKENVYTANAVLILPRGSPFTEKLDRMIHWLFATGIMKKLEYQVSLERIDDHLQTMIRFSDEKPEGSTVLNVDRIEGALYIYFGGILISVATLIGEKCLRLKNARKSNARKKIMKFLHKPALVAGGRRR